MTPYIAMTPHYCFVCTHANASPIYDCSGRMLKTMHRINEAHRPSAISNVLKKCLLWHGSIGVTSGLDIKQAALQAARN